MILAIMVVASMFIIVPPIMIFRDEYIWNNGISRKSGKPWKVFDRDSQGGYGLTDGENYTWVSWINPEVRK